MEIDDAGIFIKEILMLINSSNSSEKKELRNIVPLRVYLQSLIRFLKEQESGKPTDISISFIEYNEESRTSLLDDSRFVFHKILSAFLPYLSKDLIRDYHETTNIFFNHRLATYPLKVQLLGIEEELLTQHLEPHLKTLAIHTDFYKIRYKIIVEGFKKYNCSYLNQDELQLESVLSNYLSKITVEFILKGEILQLDTYLRNLLKNTEFPIEQRVIFRILVTHSHTFHLSSNTELLLFISDYEDIFDTEELDELRCIINHIPTGLDISSFLREHKPLNQSIISNKDIVTIIRFSIPQRYMSKGSENFIIQASKNVRIEGAPVASVFQDPIFQSQPDIFIGGVSWYQFCDLEPIHTENYSHVAIVIEGLYAPHVALSDLGNEKIEFPKEVARNGREYYPHKEYVIDVLRENFEILSSQIELNLKDININLFSNYIYSIIDKSDRKTLSQTIYGFTNLNSFSKSAGKFIEQLNSCNMSSSRIDIKTLLSSTIIKSEKNLAEFVFRIFSIVVKNSIELHGNHSAMWKDEKTPKNEIQIQPTIINLVRYIFNYMGISIVREPIAAEGQIDFLVSKTINNNDLITVPVELKLARYSNISNIEDGINAQLPVYMKDQNCNYGVFVVLWFKNDVFNKPAKYHSITDLETHIKTIKSNNRIMEMVIDCTKPISPSKLKAVP